MVIHKTFLFFIEVDQGGFNCHQQTQNSVKCAAKSWQDEKIELFEKNYNLFNK